MTAASCAIVLALVARASLGQDAPPPATSAIPAPFLAGSSSEFRRLLDLKEYQQAVVLAQQQVEKFEQQTGRRDEDLQVALMNLGLAQYLNEDYIGAEASYLRVISLIEASGHLTSPRLARAQAGLATTYYAGKRYDLAAARYEQAIALARREQGLFTEEQIPFLEKYSNALTELNRLDDALRARRYILRAIERKYGASSLRYAEELESTGRWFTRIGSYDAARSALRGSIETIEELKGENAAELISPLTALGDCARRQLLDPSAARAATPDDQRQSIFHDAMAPVLPVVSSNTLAIEGQSSLERAVAIAGKQAPPSQAQIADVRTLLGDWYQSRGQTDKALSNYALAWQAAGSSSSGGKPVTELLFGHPVLLAYVPPGSWNRYAARPAGEAVVREAQVAFTVTARGRVADPKVVTDAGDPKRGALVLRAVQTAAYRPRFENGAPVDTAGVMLVQPFYVLIEKETEGPADATATATPSSSATTEPAAQATGTPAAEPAPASQAAPTPAPESPPAPSGG
jgi:tetratricopeptide (TPR) repeat protein